MNMMSVDSDYVKALHLDQEKCLVYALLQIVGFHPTQAKAICIEHYDPLPTDEARAEFISRIDTLGEDIGISRSTEEGKELLRTARGWRCNPQKESEFCLGICDGCALAQPV